MDFGCTDIEDWGDFKMKDEKNVMIVTGAGQIGMAIARRVGFGKKIVVIKE